MAPSHKLFGEIVNNPFRSSITDGRNPLVKGGNLRDSHLFTFLLQILLS
jgi:hypothetical protein